MKAISKILVAINIFLSFTACDAQIKNAKTETVKIYGNCDMCKSTIEKAGNLKKAAKVEWNENTKMAIITYDTIATNQDEILKRIALAGYDSDKFLAPKDAYSNLPNCCQYDRAKNAVVKSEVSKKETHNHSESTEKEEVINQLKAVFDNYFEIKEALVKTDGSAASLKAKGLLTVIDSVKMESLKSEEHVVWMKVMKELAFDAEHISNTKDPDHQRNHFASLSKNMYELIKVSKQTETIYYQNCPMFNDGKGANWLSKQNVVKNPYYGSTMLSCGKTVETIK